MSGPARTHSATQSRTHRGSGACTHLDQERCRQPAWLHLYSINTAGPVSRIASSRVRGRDVQADMSWALWRDSTHLEGLSPQRTEERPWLADTC